MTQTRAQILAPSPMRILMIVGVAEIAAGIALLQSPVLLTAIVGKLATAATARAAAIPAVVAVVVAMAAVAIVADAIVTDAIVTDATAVDAIVVAAAKSCTYPYHKIV